MYKLKIIKSIVFIMTFLIVLGSLALLTMLFKNGKPKKVSIPEQISLNEPSGSSIDSLLEKNGSLYILIKDGGTSDRIVIFDTASGKTLSKITLD